MVSSASTKQRVRLWDGPTRVFHWSLLLAVGTSITTAQLGGNWMEVHGKAGLLIAGLLVFRFIWGFVGNRYARFASFVPTPQTLRSYLRGQWQGWGHNPLGALSVLALLSLLSLQVATGLFGNDEIAFTGPWAASVSEEASLWLTGWHHRFGNLLYLLLGLHVAAILFYRLVRRDNLIGPMVTGYKEVDDPHLPADDARAGWPVFLFAVALALGAVLVLSGALRPKPSTASVVLSPAPLTATPVAEPVGTAPAATTPSASAPAAGKPAW
jgi:cytochrome b